MRKCVSNRAANIGTLSVVVKCFFNRMPALSLYMKRLHTLGSQLDLMCGERRNLLTTLSIPWGGVTEFRSRRLALS